MHGNLSNINIASSGKKENFKKILDKHVLSELENSSLKKKPDSRFSMILDTSS